ncbi:MAG: hypothetical protein NUW02_03115 [Candidatus Campbellbacteria bacterium]|nr:hypothetical protein [Candidatus Campbellbacteria bacterium]
MALITTSYKTHRTIGLGLLGALLFIGVFSFSPLNANATVAPACDPSTQTLVSDSETQVGSGNAVAVTPHSVWDDYDPLPSGATWIWDADKVPADDTGSHPAGTLTFTRTFEIVGTPTGASLDITADNSYVVTINGNAVGSGDNWQIVGTHPIPASSLLSGTNTLTIEATNDEPDGPGNPAGVIFRLTVDSETCIPPATLTIVKIGDFQGLVQGEPVDPRRTPNFEFLVTGIDPTVFLYGVDLTPDADPEDNTATSSPISLAPGTYDVLETQQSAWQLADVECIYDGDSTGSAVEDGERITVESGDDVTCTFTNTTRSIVTGMKWNDVNSDRQSDDESGIDGWTINLFPYTIDEDTTVIEETPADTTTTDGDGNYSFDSLDPELNYVVCEEVQSGWEQTSPISASDGTVTCANGTVGHRIQGDGEGTPGTFSLKDFGNHQNGGSITIDKEVNEGADGTHIFTFNYWDESSFDLSANDEPEVLSNLSSGTYTISEVDAGVDWSLSLISCNYGTEYDTNKPERSVTVYLSEDQDVTCTFTNSYSHEDTGGDDTNGDDDDDGGGSGFRRRNSSTDGGGEVLGEVLGEQTSILPLGAPATGFGGLKMCLY